MSQVFAPFISRLNTMQLSLLLDTVSYFAEAPKWLSIPNEQEQPIAVPLLAETLQAMIGALEGSDASEKGEFRFAWEDTADGAGILRVTMPNGRQVEQPTQLDRFSPV